MGAGYVNLQKQRKRQQRKVGREEEGSSSNRPELAAFVLALRDTPVTKPMLYLCDNQALLESCEKIGQCRRESVVTRSARRRHFTRSSRRAPKKNNSRSSDVSAQGESASRRTCKRRSRHRSRPGNFRQRSFHGMARQDKSSSFHMTRASPERRYDEL